MIKLTQAGAGTVDSKTQEKRDLYDANGTGFLPLQTRVTGVVSYRIRARVADDAPWEDIVPARADGFLKSFSWAPQMCLQVLSGGGTVELWIGDK